jgi:HNH endonuclease
VVVTARATESGSPGRQLSRRERMAIVLERDGAACVWCRRPLEVGLVAATTEHLVPRIKGGPSWIENELAACRRCNGERGHRTPGDWFDECVRRGWRPDGETIVRALEALDAAIEARGGLRRARPYVRSQLRRLRRATGGDPRAHFTRSER